MKIRFQDPLSKVATSLIKSITSAYIARVYLTYLKLPIFFSYLNFAQSGEWERAEKSLRHYFDSHQMSENSSNVGQYSLLNLAVLNMRFGLPLEAKKVGLDSTFAITVIYHFEMSTDFSFVKLKILHEATDIARDNRDSACLLYLAKYVSSCIFISKFFCNYNISANYYIIFIPAGKRDFLLTSHHQIEAFKLISTVVTMRTGSVI